MLGVLRFWLDRGVDGFRVDVIWHLVKDEGFATTRRTRLARRHGPVPRRRPLYSADRPEVHEVIVRRMRSSSTDTASAC